MTDELPPEVKALLAAEGASPDPSPALSDAIRQRIGATLVATGAVVGVSATAEAAAVTTATTATTTTAAVTAAKLVSGKLLATIAALAIGGTAVGYQVVTSAKTSRPSVSPPTAAPPIPTATSTAPANAEPPSATSPASTNVSAPSAISTSSAPPPPSAVASRASSFTAPSAAASKRAQATRDTAVPVPTSPARTSEAEVLAEATRALAAGDAVAALAHVEEHAAQFPAGVLVEEREALRVEVLLLAGRTADARVAAEAFARRYPNTLHHRLIERATRAPKESSP